MIYRLVQAYPNLLSIQCSRRYLEVDPEIWHTCSMNSCQLVTEYFFPDRFFFSLSFLGHLGLRRFQISGKKKKKHSTAWQGLIEHVCKQSGSISEKRRGLFEFYAENMRNLRNCLGITSFSMGSTLGVQMMARYRGPTQSDPRFFARNFLQTCLAHLKPRLCHPVRLFTAVSLIPSM